MAATTSISLKLTIAYNDYSTRTYTIPFNGELDAQTGERTRTRIKAVNDSVPDVMKYTFVSENYDFSDSQAPYGVFAQIQGAEIVTEENEIVYGYGA